jgi:hypothetical protein
MMSNSHPQPPLPIRLAEMESRLLIFYSAGRMHAVYPFRAAARPSSRRSGHDVYCFIFFPLLPILLSLSLSIILIVIKH